MWTLRVGRFRRSRRQQQYRAELPLRMIGISFDFSSSFFFSVGCWAHVMAISVGWWVGTWEGGSFGGSCVCSTTMVVVRDTACLNSSQVRLLSNKFICRFLKFFKICIEIRVKCHVLTFSPSRGPHTLVGDIHA